MIMIINSYVKTVIQTVELPVYLYDLPGLKTSPIHCLLLPSKPNNSLPFPVFFWSQTKGYSVH